MPTKYISVDSDVIKAAFQEKKISMRSVAVALGGEPNKISSNLCAGRMEEGFFNNVCAILGLNPKDAEMKLPPADVRGGYRTARCTRPDGENHFIHSGRRENPHGTAAGNQRTAA